MTGLSMSQDTIENPVNQSGYSLSGLSGLSGFICAISIASRSVDQASFVPDLTWWLCTLPCWQLGLQQATTGASNCLLFIWGILYMYKGAYVNF